MAVVAPTLCFRPVDHADIPLEPRLCQRGSEYVIDSAPEIEQEALASRRMTDCLIAVAP